MPRTIGQGRLGCLQVRRTLQSFLDGEVEARRAEMVAAHLESCSRCHVEADMLARVIEAIQRLRPDLDLAAYTRLVAAVEDVTEPHTPE
ncbi:MAG: zf-HC2 domain-containing protein [Nitriliruptor sp.]